MSIDIAANAAKTRTVERGDHPAATRAQMRAAHPDNTDEWSGLLPSFGYSPLYYRPQANDLVGPLDTALDALDLRL